MHAGAEGTQYQHVTGQEEIYFGEDRGNPEAFAHAVIDAGADLVIASGPHVVRGMQFYHHHLIAYSLGNFAGYSNYEIGGELGVSCILRVKLTGAGDFVSARYHAGDARRQGPTGSGGSGGVANCRPFQRRFWRASGDHLDDGAGDSRQPE